jgi:hypothetical protein
MRQAAVAKYCGYGAGIARSPLPSAGVDKVASQATYLDALHELEQSL